MSINSRNGRIMEKHKSTHNHPKSLQPNAKPTENKSLGSYHFLLTSYNAESHPNKCFPSLQFGHTKPQVTSQLVSSTFCLRRRTCYQATHENATGKFNRGIFVSLYCWVQLEGNTESFSYPHVATWTCKEESHPQVWYIAQILNDSHSWDVGFQHKNLGQYCLEQPPSSTMSANVTNVCNILIYIYIYTQNPSKRNVCQKPGFADKTHMKDHEGIFTEKFTNLCWIHIFLAKNPYSFPGKYHDSVLDWSFYDSLPECYSIFQRVKRILGVGIDTATSITSSHRHLKSNWVLRKDLVKI